jgi:two-component system chemotaxis sensor kinase CheA
MALNNEALQQQLIKDLIIESNDGLDRLDHELLALEKGRGGPETLNIIFRVIHTIKGTAGCIGLGKIESVAHVGENLFSQLRDGHLALTPPMIAALLEYSDALKAMLRSLEQSGREGDHDYSALLDKLRRLQAGEPLAEASAAAPAPQNWGLFDDEPAPVAPAPPAPVASVAAATQTAPAAPAKPAPAETPAARSGPSVSDTAIRVEVGQLDKLMNLVGELVLARNQILQFTSESKEPTLLNASQRLNIITTELQESVMKTRMQPIENIWAKFPRIVRDVANDLGKQVRLVMEGNETELDRTIIEAIKDPLLHIVRNSLDHGFEPPAGRVAAGKAAEGVLLLRAFHEGGQVNIEISDDGDGINVPRVKQKAVEKGLVTAEAAGRMSDREAFNLIFLPGFSTADKVTNVSGRGVGMDVVKTNVEKIGGSVDVLSKAGQGTTLKIKIPLTLAIIPALIVTSGGERFAIPQVSLLELVRLEAEQARKHIEVLYGSAVYRLRGQLLPLIYLNRELKLAPAAAAKNNEAVQIVVVQADGRQFGMIVDEINDTEEIVVKPLSKQLKGIACFAGATIMGDGRVALILDVMGLAQYAKVIAEIHDRSLTDQSKKLESAGEKQSFLVFDAGTNAHMAIALSAVARLEEFPRKLVERAGGQEVVQYRGQILPLIHVARFLPDGGAPATPPDPMQVVVYTEQGRSVGLVVEHICDIVEETLKVRRDQRRAGIAGSAVIQDKVTDLLDVPGIIRAANTDFYPATKEQP